MQKAAVCALKAWLQAKTGESACRQLMMGASGLKKRELSPKSQIERGVSLFCGEEIGAEQYIDEWQYMRGRGFLEVRVF